MWKQKKYKNTFALEGYFSQGLSYPSKKYKNLSVESISKSESHCYFLLRGEDDNREGIIYIDQIQLAQLDSSVRTKPVQSFLTNLPNWC